MLSQPARSARALAARLRRALRALALALADGSQRTQSAVATAAMLRRAALAPAALLAACSSAHAPLQVVDDVDLDRYTGKWYEIASYPQRFQRGCVATSATYTRRADGRIDVLNECRNQSLDGELRRAEGVAWIADPGESNAKLLVQFFWPFRGDYWIIELDDDYRYAVIGHPSREYLWILARTPSLEPALYARLLERIEAHGYALEPLERTLQPSGP